MDEFFKALALTLPTWATSPVAAFVLFLFIWPRIKQIWYDVMPSHRAYQREKMRLELLKLDYEIAAIKKKNGLPTLRLPAAAKEHKKSRQKKATLSLIGGLIFGALGGMCVVFLRFASITGAAEFSNGKFLLGAIVGAVSLVMVSALASWASEPKTRLDAAIRGFAIAALIAVLSSIKI